MCIRDRADNRACIRMIEEKMPDLGSRASSPPTTCQVFLGWLQGKGHLEPLNQFKQEGLVYIMMSIIQANCDYLNYAQTILTPRTLLRVVTASHFILILIQCVYSEEL